MKREKEWEQRSSFSYMFFKCVIQVFALFLLQK